MMRFSYYRLAVLVLVSFKLVFIVLDVSFIAVVPVVDGVQ